MLLDVLLKFFLEEHAHLAMVVDAFGALVGLVFLDKVVEFFLVMFKTNLSKR